MRKLKFSESLVVEKDDHVEVLLLHWRGHCVKVAVKVGPCVKRGEPRGQRKARVLERCSRSGGRREPVASALTDVMPHQHVCTDIEIPLT